MSEIINLRQARKQRKRDDKSKKSAIRRVEFGTSNQEKNIIDLKNRRLSKKLDDHQREKPSGDK